jgi:organic radical activating enzyme
MSDNIVDHLDLYRLPWTLPDNGISWLEPTSMCNLHCDGCYRVNRLNDHKTFEQACADLDVFQRYRKSDCISIAGGDPLLYPDIVKLVAEIKRRELKPIINTNGKALEPELLKELHKAGVFGFTFHVDQNQGRGGKWHNKNEIELNELRLQYAEMLAEYGDIACSFNATVYSENRKYVPELIRWAQEHIDIVQTMVFILFRHVIPGLPFDWYAGSRQVDWDKIWYHSDAKREVELNSRQLVAQIREHDPEFMPSAYLNGTEQPDALKWLLSQRVGTRDRIYGYVGPKFIELLSSYYHFVNDRYLSYVSPRTSRSGRLAMFLLWPFDSGMQQIAVRYLGALVRSPLKVFKRVHLQSIMFIQPVDWLSDGRQSMCDGCPDITVHKGELVWSCRMEELNQFGTFLRSVPKEEEKPVG